MSLRPGARWSPQTQGIAGGIGSAFAGVSDQIRRVMQDRPVARPGSVTSGTGYRLTISPTVPFALRLGTISASWPIPSTATDGFELMVVGVTVGGADPGGRLWFLSSSVSVLTDGGQGGDQFVSPVGGVGVASVSLLDAPSPQGHATFHVLAW